MDLSKIISISGMGGLFKVVAQGKSGLIVESFTDKKRFPVHTHHRVSVLENTSIYISNNDNMPLKDVLKKIYQKENGGPAPDTKSSDDELKKYFESVLPAYDKEKVHTSDIRKAILWYNILQKTDLFTLKEEEKKEEGAVPTLKGDENEKKPFGDLGHENQGKHLKANMNIPKKTIGVRKTGVA